MKFIVAITVLFFFLSSFPSSTSSFNCESFIDCPSLLKFKEGITSDPYGHLRAWNTTTFFCNWPAVKCHPRLKHRVTALELDNMSLEGKMSPFLSNLSFLTTLSLQFNSLHGEIPTTLGKFSRLTHLRLRENQLQGTIPGSLQGCQRLEVLDLTYNNLSGSIPGELGRLQSLANLSLSANRLTGVVPDSLSNLTELRSLELAFNYFTGRIPPRIGALTRADKMYFHNNYFEGTIPASISNCTALRQLSFSANMLTGEIPSNLGAKLKKLKRLFFQENQLSGHIPVTLSNLSQLTLLDLSLNNLEGEVPPEFGNLWKLENLFLHSNYLVSSSKDSSFHFLTALTNCSFLKKLHLGSCLFAGSLPASVSNLSENLHYFNLYNNQITGVIPDGIGNLSGLVYLNLKFNFLNARIPATVGKLKHLQRLYMGHNRLLGPIPSEIGQMPNLGLLDLSENLISGSIPSSLGNVSQLRYLYLSHNRLSGNIPVELTRCSLLMLLDFSFNKLHGSLPIEIGHFANLALSLNLSNNNLEGELPASIGNLASVLAFDLSRNNFSGVIPTLVGNCISLEYLNLSSNMLEGTIPESLNQIRYLKVLDLASNRFTGEVPIWIGSNHMIENLNLSYNRLTGEVPNVGRFKLLRRSSFMGNVGLCGGSSLMGLLPCKVHARQRNKGKKRVYIVVSVAGVCTLLLFALIAIYSCRRFSEDENVESEVEILIASPNHRGCTLTQRELEIATGGFHETSLLGRGSFGSVYKAVINEEIKVAVKVLHKECSQRYKSFKRECQILSGIKHRNLVRMIGATWSTEFKAIVLQYVGNGNLEQKLYPRVGGCELTMRERLGILIDVAHGLEYLHEGCSVRVVHCDLNPRNVLLDDDMVAHIADFGIAKLFSADRPKGYSTSTTGFLQGSIGYIPPEYGQGIEVSEKGDVYSFGVMMLEIVTCKSPTSETFSDGLNLKKWVSFAFPNNVMDAVDISLKQSDKGNDVESATHSTLEQCCAQMLSVGLMCTEENPQKRPPISFVARGLENIWRTWV